VIHHHTSRGAQPHAQLTDREQEVATMIALGHTNKEVAATLRISVKTVEAHKSKVMEKLDIGSRAELVRFAMMQGWLAPNGK
jgi:DNA-binding NarL/FixJ family response regulator